MKRFLILVCGALLLCTPMLSQTKADQGPVSSTFGLDEKDAAAVRKIRYRMAQIRKTRPTVALVLSGGGAKGAATVGVLKYLEQYDFPIDMVVGTSIGGLVGAMYSMGYDAGYLDSLFKNMDWSVALSDKVDRKYIPYSRIRYKEKYLLSFPFYYNQDDYDRFLQGDMPFASGRDHQLRLGAGEKDLNELATNNLLGSLPSGFVFGQNVNQVITSRTVGYSDSTNFFDLPIPFACIATDMASRRAKIWHEGSINLAMRSTMSIPGLFAPVRTGGMVLVDGGMRNNFPVNVARRMGADIVIGVDLSGESSGADKIQNLGDILMASMDLFDDDAFNQNIENVDIHIHPDLGEYNMLSFNREAVDTMYVMGYKAAEAMKPQLDALRKRLGNARQKRHGPPAVDIGRQAVVIDGIDIVGVPEKEADFIRSRMKVKAGNTVGREEIEDDIAVIFGNGSYEYVNYELRGKKAPYRLRIVCKRGPMHQIGFGARIDSRDLVSLILNVGLNTHSMQGHSLDLSGRISTNPFVEVRYTYNAPKFSTFNARATVRYTNNNSFVVRENYPSMSFITGTQEIYFSNMHLYTMDFKLGLRNQVSRLFSTIKSVNSELIYDMDPGPALDYPSAFLEGRMETLDNGYFPTKGVSLGIGAEGFTDLFVPGSNKNWYLAASSDGCFPITSGRFTMIPQYAFRFIIGPEVPMIFRNVVGGDFAGRYIDHQIPFIGVSSAAILGKNVGLVRLDARYRLFSNHYVSLMGNVAYDFDSFQNVTEGTWLVGAGLGYAYNSIAGPLKAIVHWSNITRSVGVYLSFGYNF